VDALKRHGRIIYLHRTLDYLATRSEDDGNRPLLSDDETFRQLM